VLFRVIVSNWLLPFGCVIFTSVTFRATLSVTLACMVILLVWLKMSPSAGLWINTFGAKVSLPTMKMVSVELMFADVSFAKNLTVYVPLKLGIWKLVLKKALTFVSSMVCIVLLGNVTLMVTCVPLVVLVLRLMLSVMFVPISIVKDTLNAVLVSGVVCDVGLYGDGVGLVEDVAVCWVVYGDLWCEGVVSDDEDGFGAVDVVVGVVCEEAYGVCS